MRGRHPGAGVRAVVESMRGRRRLCCASESATDAGEAAAQADCVAPWMHANMDRTIAGNEREVPA